VLIITYLGGPTSANVGLRAAREVTVAVFHWENCALKNVIRRERMESM
jgi:hypothetical protein